VPDTTEVDGIIHLATGAEPTGEVPVDFSASGDFDTVMVRRFRVTVRPRLVFG
jgi:hypothetical protein